MPITHSSPAGEGVGDEAKREDQARRPKERWKGSPPIPIFWWGGKHWTEAGTAHPTKLKKEERPPDILGDILGDISGDILADFLGGLFGARTSRREGRGMKGEAKLGRCSALRRV